MKVFKDLLVLELSSVLAGPMVATFFAELGAKVIKVENKTTGGDVTRNWKLSKENKTANFSAYYCAANFGKESLMLDLKNKNDLDEVYKLTKEADIVIVNFKYGVAKKLGVDYPILKKINNQIIYAELTGFGAKSKRPAFDVVLQAETGFMYMNGNVGEEAVKMPVALIDILAAHQLKEGILIALIQKSKTGEGMKVSTSLFESAIASLANQATNWLMVNHIPQRLGSLHPNIAPYGEQFTTKDGKKIVIAVGTEGQFNKLKIVLQLEEQLNNDKFKDNASRVINRIELFKELNEKIATYNSAEILTIFEKKEIPAGLIRNMEEVFSVQIAKDMIQEQLLSDGSKAISVKTIAFDLSNN